MWNIIYISECERRSEIDSTSTMFGTIISKNYRMGRKCVKSEKKTVNLPAMWVDAAESTIHNEGNKLPK